MFCRIVSIILNPPLVVTLSRLSPALKSFPGKDDEIEKVADDSEDAHYRYGVPVDDMTQDVVSSFSISDLPAVLKSLLLLLLLLQNKDMNKLQ